MQLVIAPVFFPKKKKRNDEDDIDILIATKVQDEFQSCLSEEETQIVTRVAAHEKSTETG